VREAGAVTSRAFALACADGAVLCDRCLVADSFGTRLRGLMLRARLPAGEGLLFPRTRSVHTHFMRFPIDVVFLDGDDRVVRVVPGLRPWRAAACREARSVLELAAGEAAHRGLREGVAVERREVDA
jgi:uncharacterized membrane protein (UPF0127 family)